jgi:5'(3')-deoxyribonucleotidase
MNRVAIDVDEVLVNFLYPMAKYHNKVHKLCSKPKYNYVYRQIFDIDETDSQKMVREFYKSKDFMELTPIIGSQLAMYKLRANAKKMYVLTGRQDVVREETETWIQRYFPDIFDDVILTNSYTQNEVKKIDLCRALNIGLIIDDNIGICRECINDGVKAINFIGHDEIYPWCEKSDISLHGWDNII